MRFQSELPEKAGSLRVIAGSYRDTRGPAATFTPVDLWELRLNAGKGTLLELPEGHTTALFVLKGNIRVNGATSVRAAEFVAFERDGQAIRVDADSEATVLVLSGKPIDEPVVGYGPFVMNTPAEIHRAIEDYRSGKMGHIGA